METSDRDFMWRQFCKLGEMMGDGLHHEPDGKWIAKEYRHLAKILLPETEEEKAWKKERRQNRNKIIDKQIAEKNDVCPFCKGELKQTRSGSKTVVCQSCSKRFQYRVKK